MDNEEKPALLCIEALKACRDESAANPYIAEVLELVSCSHATGANGVMNRLKKRSCTSFVELKTLRIV